ncbi:MAG: SRPBCC domain-containing protein [Nitrospinales bacterium]
MSETFEITCEVVIQAKPETVFPYLTEEAKMKEWFGEVVEAEARPGGIFHVGSLDGLDCRGEYVEIIPNEKVIFTWGGLHSLKPGETTVEITLKAEGNATRLTLRHYNNPSKSDADGFAEGWAAHAFPLLKAVCEGRKPDGLCFRSGADCD